MKKLFIFYNFILVAIMGLTGFIGAENLTQLLPAILFFPATIYFALQVVPRNRQALSLPNPPPRPKPKPRLTKAQPKPDSSSKNVTTKPNHSKPAKIDIIDPSDEPLEDIDYETLSPQEALDADRRRFIKMIGSAGLSVFLMSIFTQKARAAFFGSVPGPGTVALKDTSGTPIDPARHHPTDGYRISEIDDATTPSYFGFVNSTGNWFIMREESSGAYRYSAGSTDFATNWTNRSGLSYDYFDSVF